MNKHEYIATMLNDMVEEAAENRAKLQEKMTSPSDFVYALGWMGEGVVLNHMAVWAGSILHTVDQKRLTLHDALRSVRDNLTKRLLRNHMNASSTSVMSNAVENLEREAASRMLDKVEGYINSLAKEESK